MEATKEEKERRFLEHIVLARTCHLRIIVVLLQLKAVLTRIVSRDNNNNNIFLCNSPITVPILRSESLIKPQETSKLR